MAPTLTGTLNMLTATIDWRDETARCVGVFRSETAAALEVEYKVHLDQTILDLLARAFLKAGIPVLRGSEAKLPSVRLIGDTLSEMVPAPKPSPAPVAIPKPPADSNTMQPSPTPAIPPITVFKMDGQPKNHDAEQIEPPKKVDRRATWRKEREAAALAVVEPTNGDGTVS